MFEHDNINEFDLQMRSILEDAQEEVPAGLWEGVSAGLEKAARRRKAALWFRYSGIAVAAAAAVVVGVVFNHGSDNDIVPDAGSEGLIAVVEETEGKVKIMQEDGADAVGTTAVTHIKNNRIAMADIKICSADIPAADTNEPQTENVAATVDKSDDNVPGSTDVAESSITRTHAPSATNETVWVDEPEKKRINTSLVISGIAGTNSPQSNGSLKPLRAPGMLTDPVKTTVEQVGEETTYGLPVSVGVGVKLNFTKRWSLGIGVNYTLLTSSFNGKYTEVKNGVASMPISERIKNTQHYIGIPVNAYYNIVSRDFINFYAYAGGTVEKCVGNIYQVQTTPVINHHETVTGVQLSANAGIGVEFLLGKHVGIYLDPSLRYYFRGNQPKSIRTEQPLMLGFEAGVRFNL